MNANKYQEKIEEMRRDTESALNGGVKQFREKWEFVPKAIYRKTNKGNR